MNSWAVTTSLLPHQVAAVEKMRPSRVGALFMDMGTGKSLATIELGRLRFEAGKIDRVVWCCPVSLKRNTRDQILLHTNCTHDEVHVFDGKTTDDNMPSVPWHIVGLESIGSSSRVVMAFNALIDDRTMLVVDESSFIKGHRAKRTLRLTVIGANARYRLVLNGTPISQGVEDLYAQMTFLSEKILGYRSWYTFRSRHLQYSPRYHGKIDARLHTDWLSAKIAPYVYQVTKDECLELPDKTYAWTSVELTADQENYYRHAKAVFADEISNIDTDDTGIAVYKLFGALQAIVSGVVPAGFTGAGESIKNNKLDELCRLVGSMPDEPIVIWVRYRASIVDVCKEIEGSCGRTVSRYYGDMSEAKRDESLQEWRRNRGVLVATMSCGGFGLTLTEAAYCIFYSNSFKYAERLQAEDRLHRIGQARNVLYTSIWANCGIEDRIASALARKEDALDVFRREVDAVRSMGTDRLHELLKSI